MYIVSQERISAYTMQELYDQWIIRPFNHVFFFLFCIFLAILIAATVIMRKKSENKRRWFIALVCFLTIIVFTLYKYAIYLDTDYHLIRADMGGFVIWGELPLHLCNINMLLIPIAVLGKNRILTGYCFFISTFSVVVALIMPGHGFNGYSLLLPRVMGFYVTHFLILISAIFLVSLDLYWPQYSDLIRILFLTAFISLVVFGINMILRGTGLHDKANYFYTVETEGNAVLDFFYGLIPYPFLYMLPGLIVLLGYEFILTVALSFMDRLASFHETTNNRAGEI